jgi:hypothetical protein
VQKLLHRQGGDAALFFVSDKFRAHRFCIISLYSAEQNNDDREDVDDDDDDDDEEVFKHA